MRGRVGLALERRRDRNLDDLRRQDAVVVDQGLQDDAGGLDGHAGIGRRAEDHVEGTRGPGEEQDLGLGRRDRQDEELVRARDGRRGARGRLPFRALGRGRDGLRDDADDLDVLQQQRELDAERVDAGDDADGAIVRDLRDRERAAAEADDEVDVVADVDEVAHAGQLVHLNGERALAGRNLERDRAVLEVAGADLGTGPQRGPSGLADRLRDVAERVAAAGRDGQRLRGEQRRCNVLGDHGPERDVRGHHERHGLDRRGGLRPLVACAALSLAKDKHDDERQCGQEDAEQQDEPTGSSHELNPPRWMWCCRG